MPATRSLHHGDTCFPGLLLPAALIGMPAHLLAGGIGPRALVQRVVVQRAVIRRAQGGQRPQLRPAPLEVIAIPDLVVVYGATSLVHSAPGDPVFG